MNGILSHRKTLLLTSTLAILLLVILAAGLSDLRLAPARSINFGGEEIRPIQDTLAEIARRFNEVPFWQQTLILGLFLFIIVLSLVFMPAEFRKRLLKIVFRMGLLAFAILYFFENFQLDAERMMPEEIIGPANAPEAGGEIIAPPPEVFQPQDASPIWGYLITLTVILAFTALIWWLWRVWDASRKIEEMPQKKLQRIAQASLDDLAGGAEWEDVIVRSYVEMGEVVNERRGIARQIEMTPHEFAQRLVAAGLPAHPVQRLTRLFERVRYSPHNARESEVAEAVDCLNEIASAFGEKL